MWTTNSRRARQVAAWAGLACAALLVTACSSTAATTGSTSAGSPTPAPRSAPASSPAGTSPASPSVTTSETGASTFIAESQDINAAALYEPTCPSGCPLSGDGTTLLYQMKWTTWSATEAVGTGIYKVDACNPNCAAGPIYPVPMAVTFSRPVKVCSASGTHWVWSYASFAFPDGLPKALQGSNAPNNPWAFSTVVAAAQQSCA